jgi:DNA-binding PadR family transcriptional regulator
MYGQELADELEKRRGTRPNPGTLYPALKELENKSLVEAKHEGRRKIYHLTENGRQGAIKACEYFCRAYSEIFQEYSLKI